MTAGGGICGAAAGRRTSPLACGDSIPAGPSPCSLSF